MILGILLAGCLDRILEAPYLLAPGLGEVRSVSPGLDGRLLVATSTGVYAVDGEGKAERLEDRPAQAVTAHPGRRYVLRDGRVTGGEAPLAVHGAVDILAGYDALVVLRSDRLSAFDPDGREHPLTAGLTDARSVALGPDDTYLVVTRESLVRVDRAGAITTLARGLVDARAAATDAKGRVYVAHGDPQELWRVDPTGLVSIARWLGDPRDLHFGIGGLLAVENTYIANGSGTVDYVRPP